MKRVFVVLFSLISLAVCGSVFFGNIHAHTSYSDGRGTPDQAFRHARDSGAVDIQAITEHCHDLVYPLPDGSMKLDVVRNLAREYTREGKFIAISGYEWTLTSRGHITIYNTEKFLDRSRSDLLDIYAWIVEKKATAQFCHPGRTYGDFFDFLYFPEVDLYINTIEVGNGAGKSNNVIKPDYLERYQRALNRGWHVGASANQDNHYENWATANDARTAFVIDELTTEKVYEALKTRNIYASEDRNAFISFSTGRAKMGDILYDLPAATLSIEYSDPGEPVASAWLYSNEGSTALEVEGDSWTVEVDVENPLSYNWYFVKIDQKDGNEIVSSPIWFQSSSERYLLNARSIDARPVFGLPFEIAFDLINARRNEESLTLTIMGEKGPVLEREYILPAMSCVEIKETLDCTSQDLVFYVNGEHAFGLKINFTRFVAHLDTSHENYYVSELKYLTELLSDLGGDVRPVIGELTESTLNSGQLLILPLPDQDTFMKDFMAISEKQITFIKNYVKSGGLLIVVLARKAITHDSLSTYERLFEELSWGVSLEDGGLSFEGPSEGIVHRESGGLVLKWNQATGKEPPDEEIVRFMKSRLKID